MSLNESRSSRRSFLQQSGSVLAGLTAAGFYPTFTSGLFGADKVASPNEMIRIGCVGVGNQGGGNLGKVLKNTIAVCDVDSVRMGVAKERVEKANGKACAVSGDYRRLLDNKEIDAIVVTTPDHWHAQITVDACAAGKDVYCEKPLSLTVADGQAMVKAARKYNRIVQTGSQQRSGANFRLACELVRSGRIGKVHTVRAGISGNNFKGKAVENSAPPKELDYEFWLGPAPMRPYNAGHVHYNFRFFWDYSGGQMTNWGAHHLDIAQWGLGMDESGPVSIVAKAKYSDKGWYEVPDWCEVVYQYANGVKMICGQGQKGGTTFEGEKGTIHVDRKRLESNPKEIIEEAIGKDDVHLYVSDNHWTNWLDCIKSRKLPICDVAIGHRSATVCHLGNIAIRTGKQISWDPEKEEIVGDQEAAGMLNRPYRGPWKLPSLA